MNALHAIQVVIYGQMSEINYTNKVVTPRFRFSSSNFKQFIWLPLKAQFCFAPHKNKNENRTTSMKYKQKKNGCHHKIPF